MAIPDDRHNKFLFALKPLAMFDDWLYGIQRTPKQRIYIQNEKILTPWHIASDRDFWLWNLFHLHIRRGRKFSGVSTDCDLQSWRRARGKQLFRDAVQRLWALPFISFDWWTNTANTFTFTITNTKINGSFSVAGTVTVFASQSNRNGSAYSAAHRHQLSGKYAPLV